MRRLYPLLLLVLLACGKDGPTEPKLSLTGSWALTISVSGPGGTCTLTAAPMTLTQTGAAFSGTYGPGSMICNGVDQGSVGGTIVNGVVNGTAVAWDLDEVAYHQTGTVNGATMSGAATWSSGVSGTWSASKH